ncbi:MAG TPA: hypothetical protein VLB07_07270 [Woeseiaceae bacterium]|nr:hypothetical protein [Woeseiaceae bacterium]
MQTHPDISMFRFALLVFLAGCLAATEEPEDSGSTEIISGFTPVEVAELVYDTSYRVPPGFYVDERADSDQSFTLHHVKDESNSYEVCTDDFNEAMSLESADNDGRSVNGLYVGSYENSRYFEFIRELSYPDGIGNVPEPTSPGYARVFKCSYVDRAGVDRHLRDGYAGRLVAAPLTLEVAKNLVEYLWQFAFFWQGQAKVLDTRSASLADSFRHGLILGIRTGQGVGKCDRIDVFEWQFTADRTTGVLEKSFIALASFEAELLNGAPRICPGGS